MRDLSRFLDNPFDAPNISLAELLSFTTDHLQRMVGNNPGNALDGRITATTSALNLVGSSATDDNVKLGVRKASKQMKDTFRKALPGKIAKVAAAVGAKFSPDAPEMTECFPQGRSVFSSCTDDQVEQHLQTLIEALGEYQPDLAAALTDTTGLLTTWQAIYGASEEATGAKTTTQEAKKLARENLQLMLFLNLLKLAEMFARQPDKLNLYMHQSLLEDTTAPDEEEEPPVPPTPPGP